jgi:hypothetical protein
VRAHYLGGAIAAAGLLGFVVSAVSCVDDSGATSGTEPCPQGICGSGGGSSGPGSGGGGPGSGGAGGGPVTCGWFCTPWDTEGNGDSATRTCVDVDGCADPDAKPPEAATLPALDEDYYRCNIEPILDRLCAHLGCHGVEPDIANGDPGRALRTYHRGRLRVRGYMIPGEAGCLNQPPVLSDTCIGCIECACFSKPHLPVEWQRNFDAARGFALDLQAQPLADVSQSELLTQPLRGNGLAHAGIKTWDTTDTDYQTILSWLQGMTLANCTTTN